MTAASRIKTLVMIPTYNEIDNVELIISRIRALDLDTDILFVDDNSPDGTGKLLNNLSQQDKRIHVLQRPGKMGVGSAHLDGIAWAYDRGVETLITMDSDQSHSPEDIFSFLEKADDADVVVGSRFMAADSLVGWSPYRKLMTHTGHFLTRILLRTPFDATGAFRVYKLGRIPRAVFAMVESPGYSFFYESLHRLHLNAVRVAQVPITLPVRTYGHSKMRFSDVVNGVVFLFMLALRTRTARASLLHAEPVSADSVGEGGVQQKEWDAYWHGQNQGQEKSGAGKGLYSLIAAFYRRVIIRPAVNHFLGRYFLENAKVLHAGCGSGAVDVDMAKALRITALDLSPAALTEYARHHPGHEDLVKGSILDIPAEPETFDGVFNLGVMEHFHEPEIEEILREFNRVLKPGGRAILFWPPAWGLSVNVLKGIHFVLNDIFRRDVKLHPDEHTHVTSRKQTAEWLGKAGFEMVDFYFGPRDFFTHQIIVAEKSGEATGRSPSS